MNAAIVLSLHGSFEGISKKLSGDLQRLSESFVIKKYSMHFERIFVFTHDSRDFSPILPKNCIHIRMYSRIIYLFFGWLFLLYHVKKNKIDIVYLEGGPALPVCFLLNKLTNTVVFLNYNYLWYTSYAYDRHISIIKKLVKNNIVSFLVKAWEKFLLNFMDYTIVSSNEIKRFVGNNDKILDIKKGIITEKFNPEKIRAKTKRHSIIFSGRLVRMKDPLTLIKAYRIAKKKIPDLSLIICGEGELEKKCKKLADSNVHFMGFTKNIPYLLKSSEIFVLSSAYDPSPRSLMEAMTMGKPCIATNVGGVPDYLDSTCGILVEPKNPQALAEKIVYLMKNSEKAKVLGRNARKKMLKYHSLEKNIERQIKFLTKTAKRRLNK